MSILSLKEPTPRQNLPHFYMIRDEQANVRGYIQGCENGLDAKSRALLDQKMEKVLRKTDRIFIELVDVHKVEDDQYEWLRPTFSQVSPDKISTAVQAYLKIFAEDKSVFTPTTCEVQKKVLAQMKPVDQLFTCVKLYRQIAAVVTGASTDDRAPFLDMGHYLGFKFQAAQKDIYELYPSSQHSIRLKKDHKPEDCLVGMLNTMPIEKWFKCNEMTMCDWLSDERYTTQDLATSECFANRILKDLQENLKTKALYTCNSTLLYDVGGVLPLLRKQGFELLKTV